MKKLLCSLIALSALMLSPVAAFAADDEVPLPSNLKVEKPQASVPANCARFFQESGWSNGKWGGKIPNQLWVEKIADDCTVQAVYAWGDSPAAKVDGGFARVKAQIKGDRLFFTLNPENPKVTVVYAISEKGDELTGRWQSEGATQAVTSRIKLTPGAKQL